MGLADKFAEDPAFVGPGLALLRLSLRSISRGVGGAAGATAFVSGDCDCDCCCCKGEGGMAILLGRESTAKEEDEEEEGVGGVPDGCCIFEVGLRARIIV